MPKSSQQLFKPFGIRNTLSNSLINIRDLVSAYLPADQNHALMKVAGAVMELHSECIQKAKQAKVANMPKPPPPPPPQHSDSHEIEEMTNMLNKSVLADPAGTIFSAVEHVLTEKRNFDEDFILTKDGEPNYSTNPERFFGEKNASRYSGIDLRNTSPRKNLTGDRRKLYCVALFTNL